MTELRTSIRKGTAITLSPTPKIKVSSCGTSERYRQRTRSRRRKRSCRHLPGTTSATIFLRNVSHHCLLIAKSLLNLPFLVPPSDYGEKKPLDGDCSVMTYRGHRVRKTLIRAKFSPLETTGNRFIYTGCSTGRVIMYDTLTGKIAGMVNSHSDLVRDVSWHPRRPEIASASVRRDFICLTEND